MDRPKEIVVHFENANLYYNTVQFNSNIITPEIRLLANK